MNQPTDVRYAQLFLDDEIVEQTVRLQRVVHHNHINIMLIRFTQLVRLGKEMAWSIWLGYISIRRTTFGRHGMPPYTHQHTLRLFTQSV